MKKNVIVLIVIAACTLTSCRRGSSPTPEPGQAPTPPAPAAPAAPAPPTAPTEPEAPKSQPPMIGKTTVTHFRILDLKKFKQISTKGTDRTANPDLYAVNGKALKHQSMLAELKRGATACFTRIVGRDPRQGETLLVTSSLSAPGQGDSQGFHFANISFSSEHEKGIIITCMKHAPVTGVGFKQALKGIVELLHRK